LFAHNFAVQNIVWLVLLHQTVAFSLNSLVTFIDGEVEWSFQVIVNPGTSFFYLEIVLTAAWHHPNDDGYGYDD
jgi:hypothetical protein